MSNTQMISVKDTRNNLAELLELVAISKRQFVITKFGKPKAKLVPMTDRLAVNTSASKLTPEFKAWLDNFSRKYKKTIEELARLP